MEQVIAALILACSNLSRVDMNFIKEKSDCIQRVSKCSADVIHGDWSGDRERTVKILNQCSKEVRL